MKKKIFLISGLVLMLLSFNASAEDNPIPTDLDKNGEVNIMDVAFAARYYNLKNEQVDLNADGIIDIFDITKISRDIGIKASDIVFFPDSNLEKVVRNKINKPIGYIFKKDVENIEELDCWGNNITNISGIENIKKLKRLDLFNNKITNIEPLGGLVNLTNLKIGCNEITDIKPLENLTNLESLDIRDNRIINIEVIANFNKLKILNASGNSLDSITHLSNLYTLNELYLMNCEIRSIEPLKDLINLTKLSLEQNYINDINVVENITNLKFLNLKNNHIININSLKKLINLDCLYLRLNGISDYSPIVNQIPALVEKDFTPRLYKVTDTGVINIRVIKGLEWTLPYKIKLRSHGTTTTHDVEWANETINMDSPGLYKFTGILKDINKEITLNLTVEEDLIIDIPDDKLENAIRARLRIPSDYLYKHDLAAIDKLYDEYGGINNIEGIEHLINLVELNLQHNEIMDITPVKGLENMDALNFQFNKLNDIGALKNLKGLDKLYLGYNGIEDYSSVYDLYKYFGQYDKDFEMEVYQTPEDKIIKTKIIEGQPWTLPGYVSDKIGEEYKIVPVIWDSSEINTLNPGEYTIRGKINNVDDIYIKLLIEKNEIISFADPAIDKQVRIQLNKATGDIRKLDVIGIYNLHVTANHVSDISGIENLINLYQLTLFQNDIKDITQLKNLTKKLRTLNLASNKLEDISSLQYLTKLKNLYLYDNNISYITALSKTINLVGLELRNNPIRDYSPVASYYNNLISKDFTLNP